MFVKEITKRYDGKAVVDGVSFEIPKGKVLSLIGPNGAGKSTVMGMLSRLIARDSGLVDFEGTEITHWKSRELSKRLAILTQSNNVQMKLTVRELVAFGRFPYSGGRLTQEDNEIIDRAIAYMELGDYEEQFIDELSGGQRQRAYIAMVIAQDTDYILLDEPTNNLDAFVDAQMVALLVLLAQTAGAVAHHHGGHTKPLHRLCVPEIRTGAEVCFFLQRHLLNDLFNVHPVIPSFRLRAVHGSLIFLPKV